jgi:mRNA-degrading endonuclease RelE of RelBE toxin-antitoxin system
LSLFRIDAGFTPFASEVKLALRNFPTFKADLLKTFETLETTPRAGDAIPRVGPDIFKIRLGVKGRFGKRGGYRLIYHVDWSREVITPLALYFKKDTPNMADSEIIGRFEQVLEYIIQHPPQIPPPLIQ